jgi:hypothetical protein
VSHERAHLEALLIGRALLDPSIVDGAVPIDRDRLSVAAARMLEAVLEAPAAARIAGILCVTPPSADEHADAFCVRLERRVDALTLADLRALLDGELVAAVNALPRLGAASPSDRAA